MARRTPVHPDFLVPREQFSIHPIPENLPVNDSPNQRSSPKPYSPHVPYAPG